jgi:hypothetical protein
MSMQGIMIFRSLPEALNAGYHIFDRRADGYLMRTSTSRGYAFAMVILAGLA